jgi:hypothetical protein
MVRLPGLYGSMSITAPASPQKSCPLVDVASTTIPPRIERYLLYTRGASIAGRFFLKIPDLFSLLELPWSLHISPTHQSMAILASHPFIAFLVDVAASSANLDHKFNTAPSLLSSTLKFGGFKVCRTHGKFELNSMPLKSSSG